MTIAAGLVNLVLGVAYLGLGTLILVEMRRDWWIHGFSPFGAAIAALAFTCGPHHAEHGIHLLVAGRQGQALDLAAVSIGLVPGVCWLLLRVESFLGGLGDRFVPGSPPWVRAIPVLGAGYALGVAALASRVRLGELSFGWESAASVLLTIIYGAIGAVLTATQLRNHRQTSGWSLSGLALSGLFSTCLVMHAAHSLFLMRGDYERHWHGLVTDWISVPAGLWFLAVVVIAYRESGPSPTAEPATPVHA